MKPKKSPRADLNRYTALFLWLGLVMSLFVFWRFIEYKQPVREVSLDMSVRPGDDPFEQDTVVRLEPVQKPEPVKKFIPDAVKKVKDNQKVETPDFQPTDPSDDPIDNIDEIRTVDPEPEPVDNVDFIAVEQAPVFPGCEKYADNRQKLKKCMARKIEKFVRRRFNKDLAEDIGATGVVKVYVTFLVDEHGRVSKIRARSPYQELKDEAVRVIRQLPEMKPGRQRNKTVGVYYTLPIVFRVN